MSPVESFVALFSSIGILPACLWVVGVILFSIEFFQPMRGISYMLGVVLLGAAFATRMLYGSAGEAFMFVLFTAVLLFAVHVVALATQKRDWLRVARMEKAGARSRKYDTLIDSIGVANTPIDLTGSVTVNDVNLVVFSDTPIGAGERVRIIGVTPEKIIVERAISNPDD